MQKRFPLIIAEFSYHFFSRLFSSRYRGWWSVFPNIRIPTKSSSQKSPKPKIRSSATSANKMVADYGNNKVEKFSDFNQSLLWVESQPSASEWPAVSGGGGRKLFVLMITPSLLRFSPMGSMYLWLVFPSLISVASNSDFIIFINFRCCHPLLYKAKGRGKEYPSHRIFAIFWHFSSNFQGYPI